MPEPRELVPPQNTVNLQENIDGLECCYGFVPSSDGILYKKKFKTADVVLQGSNLTWYDSANAVTRRIVSNKQVVWNNRGDLVVLGTQYRGTLGHNNEVVAVEKDANSLHIKRFKKFLVPAYLKVYYTWKNRTNTTTYSECHNYSTEFDILSQRLYNGVECIGFNGPICPTGNRVFYTRDGSESGYVRAILDKVLSYGDFVRYVLSNGDSLDANIDVIYDGNSQNYFYVDGRWYSYCAVWDGSSLQPACDSSLGMFMIDYGPSQGKLARFISGASTSTGVIPSITDNTARMLTPVVYLEKLGSSYSVHYGHTVWYSHNTTRTKVSVKKVQAVGGGVVFGELSPSSSNMDLSPDENFVNTSSYARNLVIPIAVRYYAGWLELLLYWKYDTSQNNWSIFYYTMSGIPRRNLFTCISPRRIDGSLLFGSNMEMMRPTLMFSYKDDTDGRYHFVYFVKTAQSETSSVMSYYMLDVSFRVTSSNDYIDDVEFKADLLEDISAIGAANVTINDTNADPSSGYVFIQDFHIPLVGEMLSSSGSEYDDEKPIESSDVRALVPSQGIAGNAVISHYASLHGSEFVRVGEKSLQVDAMSESSRVLVYLDLDNDVHNLNAISVRIGDINTTYETSMYPYHVIIKPKTQNPKKEVSLKVLDVYNFSGRIFAINADAPNELMFTVPNSYIFSDLIRLNSEVIDFVPAGNYAYIFAKDGVYILFETNDTLVFEKISDLRLYTGGGSRDLSSAISILDGAAFVSAEKRLYFARGTAIKELNVNGINYALTKYASTLNLSKVETKNLLLVTPSLYPNDGGYIVGGYIGRGSLDTIRLLSSPEYSTFAIDMTAGTMFNLGVYSKVRRDVTGEGTYEDWFFGIGLIGIGRVKEVVTDAYGKEVFEAIEGVMPSAVVGTQNQYVEDDIPDVGVEHRVKEVNVLAYRIVGDLRLVKVPEKLILMMDSYNAVPPPYEEQDIVAFVDNTYDPSIHDFFNLWDNNGNFNTNMRRSNTAYRTSDDDVESFVMRPQGQFQKLLVIINPNRKDTSDVKIYGLRAFIVPRTFWY